MANTPNLALPYIDQNQSQKHVTHNVAIRELDALVQLAVLDDALAAPPASPADGDRHIVAAGPTGAWAGHAGKIAAWQDGAWSFYAPKSGWFAWVASKSEMQVWTGSAWASLMSLISILQNLSRLGVGTTADAANPLAVKSNSALFTAKTVAEGGNGDLRFTLNKESAAKTVSQLYQTNWSGRAETGLMGDDHFRIKVSADGSNWKNAIDIDPSNGNVGVGTASPQRLFHVQGGQGVWRLDRDGGTAALQLHRFPAGNFSTPWKGFMLGVDATASGVGSFSIYDYGTAVAGAATVRFTIDNSGHILPGADNTQNLGSASARFAVVYAGTGTINTSDAREKEWLGALNDAERAVGRELRALFGKFRWTSAIALKGNGARTHVGVTAQDVEQAFAKYGLDARAYALFCEDQAYETIKVEQQDEDYVGPDTIQRPIDGEVVLGVRYDQLFSFVLATL